MPNRIEMFRRVERQYFRDRLGTLGLQPLDGLIIRQLGREGHLKQEELACKIAVDKGAVARSLARLEEQGRAYARRILQPIYDAEEQAMARTLEQFSPDFLLAVEALTEQLCRSFHEHILDRKEP